MGKSFLKTSRTKNNLEVYASAVDHTAAVQHREYRRLWMYVLDVCTYSTYLTQAKLIACDYVKGAIVGGSNYNKTRYPRK